jgi:hypothetical protein
MKSFVIIPALANVYAKLSSLASTAIGLGASMIGIYDENENFTGDSVEEALEEIGDKLKVGVSGTFTTADKTVTVTDGIITAIEDIV